MRILEPSFIDSHVTADPFWQQAALNAVGPVLTAFLGGLVVSILIQQIQSRRARQELRSTLSFEMMRTAYQFYYPLIEAVRSREHWTHSEHSASLISRRKQLRPPPENFDSLSQQYEDFRVAARVLEEQLRVSFPDIDARWLWHGVVDMLTARYFRLVHEPERYSGLAERHGKHTVEQEISPAARKLFMTLAEYQDAETVDAQLLRRFEIMLDQSIRIVLRTKIDPPSGAAILRAGRLRRL